MPIWQMAADESFTLSVIWRRVIYFLWQMTRRHIHTIHTQHTHLYVIWRRVIWYMTWLFIRGSNCHMKWVTWRSEACIRVCVIGAAYLWRDSFICVTWLIHMCNMTHSYVCVRLIHTWHDCVMRAAARSHTVHSRTHWHSLHAHTWGGYHE